MANLKFIKRLLRSRICAWHDFHKVILAGTELWCHILWQLAFFSSSISVPPCFLRHPPPPQSLITLPYFGFHPHHFVEVLSSQRDRWLPFCYIRSRYLFRPHVTEPLDRFDSTLCEVLSSLGFQGTSLFRFSTPLSSCLSLLRVLLFCMLRQVAFGNPSPSLGTLSRKPVYYTHIFVIPQVFSSELSSILNSIEICIYF